jgi:hypothetical protein
MASKRSTLALILALIAAVLVAGLQPAAAQPAVLDNGAVKIGVNPHGHLNVLTNPAHPELDASWLGLRFGPWDGLRHIGPREGWGVAVPGIVTGDVNNGADPITGLFAPDPFNMALCSFTSDGTTATSIVQIGTTACNAPTGILEVQHQWAPIEASFFTPYLFKANVFIRNLTPSTLSDVRYRRVMDWDAEPTPTEEYVTIGGMNPKPPYLRFSSDDGFETADPLQFVDSFIGTGNPGPVDVFQDYKELFLGAPQTGCGFTMDFMRCGIFYLDPSQPGRDSAVVPDHGALFDFAFPALAPSGTCDASGCDTRVFTIFYGAAPTLEAAQNALYQVGAEVFSLANCQNDTTSGDPDCDPVAGTPVTFIFGTNGLGGSPAFGDVFGTAFVDNNGNGTFDAGDTPLSGVTVTATGHDQYGNPVTRTVTTNASGGYDITALPRGSYALTAANPSGGYALSTIVGGAPFVITADDFFPRRDLIYVTGSIAGTIYGDADGSLGLTAADISVGAVTVTLTGIDTNGSPVSRTSTTTGGYLFDKVLAGTYLVSVPSPLGGLVTSTPSPRGVVLAAGQNSTGNDIGYCLTTATSVVSTPNPSVFGDGVTITATVTSPCGSAVTSGSVLISIDGDSGSTFPVDASGVATTSTSGLGGGTHTITATYVSDGVLQGSTSTTSQTVSRAPSLTTLTSSQNPSRVGQSVTFTASLTSRDMAVSDGTVTFTVDGSPIGTVPVSSGSAAISSSTLTLGGHSIGAEYSGTANYGPSTAGLTQNVNDATTTSVASGTNPSIVGQSVTFTATVTAAGGEAVTTGSVTFKEGSTVLAGPIAVNATGHAAFSTSTLTVGGHTISAFYSSGGVFGDSNGSVAQQVNNPAVAESCFTFDFREITYFKTTHVIMSSDATIRGNNGIGGGFNPAVWPYNPAGGTNKTVSRGTLFRLYGFADSEIGHTIPNADNPAITYTVQADPQIPSVNFIDLGGPAKVFICPSQLQTKLIEGTPVKSWNLPGTTQLADVSKNIPGVMLNHNIERIVIPARVRNELAALGMPLKNPNGTSATYGLIDYVGVQQWGHGNANFREKVDLQIQFVSDDPANRPLHYQVGFHTATNRDFEGFASCDYEDYNPGNDGVRMNDVWAGTNAGNPNWGPACGSLEPSINQRRREQYVVPLNAVQINTTVNTHDDTMRVFYGTIRPAGTSSSGY